MNQLVMPKLAYKRPESVLVVIYTAQQKVLLLQRKDRPELWQSVTGSLEPNEQPHEAAARELFEETGLRGELKDHRRKNRFPILPAWRKRYAPEVTFNIEHVFTLCLPQPCDIQLHPDEHTAWRWLERETAIQEAFSWSNRSAIRDLI
ncbi:MAG: dihydroneopterin triphosphate diphosphatase [Pseudomonadota bacterium]